MSHGRPQGFLIAVAALSCFLSWHVALADVYLNNPRGSNNKMTEQSNNANNQNRLFDSQNNAAGGYQVGDKCSPTCKTTGTNNYDATKPGSQEGQMYYFQGSELYVEWTNQHSCGIDASAQNTECQVVLQYMCASDAPGLRDGKDPNAGTRRRSGGGNNNNPQGANNAQQAEPSRGRHETFAFYDHCRKRQRNKGLYTAGRNLNKNNGATATRQNNNGQRRGLECPEERDYYPYWHPTTWRDIVVLTTEPTKRCKFYREESQNVKAKGYCKDPKLSQANPDQPNTLNENDQVPNNKKACAAKGYAWVEVPAHGIDPPECWALPLSRDNHHGNIANGHPMSYTWKVPDTIASGDVCVLRTRYNITSGDFSKPPDASAESQVPPWDYFFDLDSRYNGKNPIAQDPKKDFVGLGENRTGPLQLQVNTAQFGRTFEDRTHTFKVLEVPAVMPSNARIVNYNVRGRRGNIVQVYPSVEYDFVPPDIEVPMGTFLHFQWTGSDANANGNAGNGRQGTDRNNLVQIKDRLSTKPLPIDEHTLFFDAKGKSYADTDLVGCHTWTNFYAECGRSRKEGESLVESFAYLKQPAHAASAGLKCPTQTEVQAQNRRRRNDNDENNCLQLNVAPAYFDGGLVEMRVVGDHHIASTRNNDYSNRSQKATIKVKSRVVTYGEMAFAVVASIVGVALAVHVARAIFAFRNPTSDAFGSRRRPILLKLPCLREAVRRKEEERRLYKQALQQAWKKQQAGPEASTLGTIDKGDSEGPVAERRYSLGATKADALDMTLPPHGVVVQPDSDTGGSSKALWCGNGCVNGCVKGVNRIFKCCMPCWRVARANCHFGFIFQKNNLFAVAFVAMNLLVAVVGYMRNKGLGFNDWYPVAKCGGYILDFNLAVILLPTLRTVQTGARQISALDTLLNEDPIQFHMRVAACVAIGTLIHVIGHWNHSSAITQGPIYRPALTPAQELSGTTWFEQLFNPANRAAAFTGLLILYLMSAMFLTANTYVRRRTYELSCPGCNSRDLIGWVLLLTVGLVFCPLWGPVVLWKVIFRRLPETRKLGGFTVFWEAHKLWKPIFVLLLFHGPNCWIWFMFPFVLLACDRLLKYERRNIHLRLRSAEVLKGKVMKLIFAPPPGFVYQAGMYVLLNCDLVDEQQWHPFTLTSAPEEDHLSVTIRCPDTLDWCSALRRKMVEGPAVDISKASKSTSALDIKSNARLKVTYSHYTPEVVPGPGVPDDGTYARPWKVETFGPAGEVANSWQIDLQAKKAADTAKLWQSKSAIAESPEGEAADAEEIKVSISAARSKSSISLEDMLKPKRPIDVVRFGVDGPHGAPSELVWQHKVVVLVGAGIGVTPFASILRSITLRMPSKAELMGHAGSQPVKSGSHLKLRESAKRIIGLGESSPAPSVAGGSQPGAPEEYNEPRVLQWKPCEHVHFFWLCRSQDEFEWFYDLLRQSVEAAQKGHIELNMFETGEQELSKVKDLGSGFTRFFGRPNWGRIFPKIAKSHPGENIGVFLCGPAALRDDLRRGISNANKNEDATNFMLYAENF